jgi:GNAT superfamily N-acetyltransferase
MDGIVVRATQPSDGARLDDIWIDAAEYYAELDPSAFRVPSKEDVAGIPVDPPSESTLSLVAEIDGMVVGFLDAHVDGPAGDAGAQMIGELSESRMIVDALVVERRHWRRGAGGALLLAAEDWARERGVAVVAIDTYVDSPVSVPFYEERMGYARRSISFRKRL